MVAKKCGGTDTYTIGGKLYPSDDAPSLELVQGEESFKKYSNCIVVTSARLSYKVHFRDIWYIYDNKVCLTGGRELLVSDSKVLEILREELEKVEEEL